MADMDDGNAEINKDFPDMSSNNASLGQTDIPSSVDDIAQKDTEAESAASTLEEAPVEEAPVEEAPVEEAPVEEAPEDNVTNGASPPDASDMRESQEDHSLNVELDEQESRQEPGNEEEKEPNEDPDPHQDSEPGSAEQEPMAATEPDKTAQENEENDENSDEFQIEPVQKMATESKRTADETEENDDDYVALDATTANSPEPELEPKDNRDATEDSPRADATPVEDDGKAIGPPEQDTSLEGGTKDGNVVRDSGDVASPKVPEQDADETRNESSKSEDAPLLEQEAPQLEQEAPILVPQTSESKSGESQDVGGGGEEASKDKSKETGSKENSGSEEAMDVDDEPTTSEETQKGVEMETGDIDASNDAVEGRKSGEGREESTEGEMSEDKFPEPPVLDPEEIIQDEKESDDMVTTKFNSTDKETPSGSASGDASRDKPSDENSGDGSEGTAKDSQYSDTSDVKSKPAVNKNVEDDDDDVMVIEDEQTPDPEPIVLDDDDDDDSAKVTKDKGAAQASSNDTGLQIASVTGAEAKSHEDSQVKKVKEERHSPPPSDAKKGQTSTPGKKSSKNQSCIVCGKVGRCKYNIVRNGDIKHLCDDVCFRKFRSNPTMFLKSTSITGQQKSSPPPTTRMQSIVAKPPPKAKGQPDYKTCTVCQLMNINTQKPFILWMNLDFCGQGCLTKYQGNLSSSCSNCKAFISPAIRPLYCHQVGTDFKTFCTSKCSTDFKKRVKPLDDVEIIGVEGTGKKSVGQNARCAVCSKSSSMKHNIKLNGLLHRLCSDPCLSAFQYANKLAMNTCDNCGGMCPTEEIVSHFIQFEGQQKRFCKDACVNTFRSKHRKTVACAWCGSRKTNFDMIERVDSNNKYQLFCSLNCLSLYRVNLQAKSNQAVVCDHCRKCVPAQYHLTMSDASVRNFCSYNCVMSFQSQFSANSNKNSSQPTIHSKQRVQLQSKPTPRESTTLAQTSQPQSNSFPIISNVVSLAPQGQKQQTVNIKSSTPVPVVLGQQGGKQTVSTGTQQQIIIQPPPPKQMKNKSLLCKPFVQTKATSCRPHTQHKECQTDEQKVDPVLIPIPIPIYIPCPMAMYAAPIPQLCPIPIPIPVPIFIPTVKKSAEKILKHIKEIQEKIPSDPLEAELLMMAEAVAGGGDSDSDSDHEMIEPFEPAICDKPEGEDMTPLMDPAPPGGEEDLVQMALRMAEEITGPILDLESSVDPVPVNTEPPAVATPEPVGLPEVEEEEEYVPPRETRGRRGKRSSRGRGGRPSKKQKVAPPPPELEPPSEPSPPPVVSPDASMHLKYTYGVNAWKHWVVHKNTLLEKVSKRGSGKLKLFKTDLLQCTADELNYSLCLFVKEVRKPNGDEYSPDSIYYLCLGIQQYLYENSRIDNIFTDLYYEKFTECLNDVLAKYEPKVNASGQMLCRIEEEHMWESKQLGAHSPYVLLNTLIYFNTKHFMLKTTEEHMKLSFAHILKHWKKGGPGSKVVTGQGRSVSLRYYCLSPGNGLPSQKKPKEGIPVYETSENLENPLRCPVKLYEFYLSKWYGNKTHPESIKNRNDMFYLVPERSCVPDSPVWYSTQSIAAETMSKMLNRILLIREIQEAHLHAQPIYV